MRYSAKEARETAIRKVSTEKILDEVFMCIRNRAEQGYRSLRTDIDLKDVNITDPMLNMLRDNPMEIINELREIGYGVFTRKDYIIITW